MQDIFGKLLDYSLVPPVHFFLLFSGLFLGSDDCSVTSWLQTPFYQLVQVEEQPSGYVMGFLLGHCPMFLVCYVCSLCDNSSFCVGLEKTHSLAKSAEGTPLLLKSVKFFNAAFSLNALTYCFFLLN